MNSPVAMAYPYGYDPDSPRNATSQLEAYFKALQVTPMADDKDMVNSPSHYTQGSIECIDAIEQVVSGLDGMEAMCTGNAIKYLWRWKHKNGVEDLKKAVWYLQRMIDNYDE